MLLKRIPILGLHLAIAACFLGCGNTDPPVADAPEQPAPELTPEERQGEMEYTGQRK